MEPFNIKGTFLTHGTMMSDVYYTDMRVESGDNLIEKTRRLISEAGVGNIDMERKFVAIKLHFGEYGNLSYLRPNYVRVISDAVKAAGGIPFMTDCSTLYVGMRKNAVDHMQNAELNGFGTATAGCPVIIADGLRGTDDVEIPVEGGEYVETAKIGRAICDADVIITLNHFKCHELTGFGGALKNLGMGCGSRRGKMEMHASEKPSVDDEKCKGCGKCTGVCAHGAVEVVERKAALDHDICVGCGRCIGACPFDAVGVEYDDDKDLLNSKIVEYAKAVVHGKPNFHVTVLADVSPFCDCHSDNDMPVIPNVGIFASSDPVAIDRACVDMAQSQPMNAGSRLYENSGGVKPDDIFLCTNPKSRWKSVFSHADKIGMGDGSYVLRKVR